MKILQCEIFSMNVWKTWKGGTVLKCPALMLNKHDLRLLTKPRNGYQLTSVSGNIYHIKTSQGAFIKEKNTII